MIASSVCSAVRDREETDAEKTIAATGSQVIFAKSSEPLLFKREDC